MNCHIVIVTGNAESQSKQEVYELTGKRLQGGKDKRPWIITSVLRNRCIVYLYCPFIEQWVLGKLKPAQLVRIKTKRLSLSLKRAAGTFWFNLQMLILAMIFVLLQVKSFVQLSDKDRSRRGRKK